MKETTRKTDSQEGGFLNFIGKLITAGLLLLNNVLTPLGKSIQMHRFKRKINFLDRIQQHYYFQIKA